MCTALPHTIAKMIDRSPDELQLRKLRKKLRQIDNLETIGRDLNEDELNKVHYIAKVVVRLGDISCIYVF